MDLSITQIESGVNVVLRKVHWLCVGYVSSRIEQRGCVLSVVRVVVRRGRLVWGLVVAVHTLQALFTFASLVRDNENPSYHLTHSSHYSPAKDRSHSPEWISGISRSVPGGG